MSRVTSKSSELILSVCAVSRPNAVAPLLPAAAGVDDALLPETQIDGGVEALAVLPLQVVHVA